MEGTIIQLSDSTTIVVKESFVLIKQEIFYTVINNKIFIQLTDEKTKEPIMININHIVFF